MTARQPRGGARTYVVGLIADTHGLLRPEVAPIFAGADVIVHAGDVGGGSVLEALTRIAPVEAVYGNVDDSYDPRLARERAFDLGGVSIHVSHGHELARTTPEMALAAYAAAVVVFGHTHRAVIVRDEAGRLAVNPGAAGPKRFDLRPSVARLTIASGKASVELIDLLPSGAIQHEGTK